jgi:hypothetical protein
MQTHKENEDMNNYEKVMQMVLKQIPEEEHDWLCTSSTMKELIDKYQQHLRKKFYDPTSGCFKQGVTQDTFNIAIADRIAIIVKNILCEKNS